MTTRYPASCCKHGIRRFCGSTRAAGLMVINYLTTSLRRQKLRRGTEYDSSLRARRQRTHCALRTSYLLMLSISYLQSAAPRLCTSPAVALFRSVNTSVCVCACVCVCDLVLQPSSIEAGAVNRSVWPACRDKGVSISGPSSCQVRAQYRDTHFGPILLTSFQHREVDFFFFSKCFFVCLLLFFCGFAAMPQNPS